MIYDGCLSEISNLGEAFARDLRILLDKHTAETTSLHKIIDQQKEELVRKNPSDLAKEAIVEDLLKKLDKHSEQGRRLLGWLLTNGRSDQSAYLKPDSIRTCPLT